MQIGRLGGGRAEYYLSQVVDGVEDYYTERGEAPGVWLGAGTGAVGLDGRVEGDDLRAVLSGHSPGGLTIARGSRKTPGFDVTFRAPNSVSLLYALAEPAVRTEVQAGHDAAVRETVAYLERVACLTRRGPQGRETIRGHGFVAAGCRHRTSRAGDPQLHTHVLIANAVLGIDGRWSALDARHLYRQSGTARSAVSGGAAGRADQSAGGAVAAAAARLCRSGGCRPHGGGGVLAAPPTDPGRAGSPG